MHNYCVSSSVASKLWIHMSLKENPVIMSVLSEHGKSMEGHVKERYVQTIIIIICGQNGFSKPSKQTVSHRKSSASRINRFSQLLSIADKSLHKGSVQGFWKFRSFESDGVWVCSVSSRFDGLWKVCCWAESLSFTGNKWPVNDSFQRLHRLWSCCVARVLFYLEAWNRIYGQLAYTQVKCSWLLLKSCAVPIVSDLFQIEYLDHGYPALPRKCTSLKLHISVRNQSSGNGYMITS